MSERRTLTIGVAINLGNYESLRLEVSDEVKDEVGAAELAAYLNRVLDGYGQTDATTRASIDKYRARVLEKHATEEPAASAVDPRDEFFGPAPTLAGVVKKTEPVVPKPVTVEPVLVKTEELNPVPEPIAVEPTLVETEEFPAVPEQVAEKPAEEPITYSCEKCGAAVSKVQRDVSNLFMGKTLCKACMK